MTAAVPDPRFRDQLAEAMTGWSVGDADNIVYNEARDLADALMPVIAAEVEARVQAAANQRAVKELRKAADWLWDDNGEAAAAYHYLADRAAALDAEAGPSAG